MSDLDICGNGAHVYIYFLLTGELHRYAFSDDSKILELFKLRASNV